MADNIELIEIAHAGDKEARDKLVLLRQLINLIQALMLSFRPMLFL